MSSFNVCNANITDTVLRNNAVSRKLLKLDHLTDLGLELFPEPEKFDSGLKNGVLESVLLSDESEPYSVSDSMSVAFDSFNGDLSHNMPSLSPTETNNEHELIEVFPDLNSMVYDAGVEIANDSKKTAIVLNRKLNGPNALRRRTSSSINGLSPGRRNKVRRTLTQPKLKKKVVLEKREPGALFNSKKITSNSFAGKFNDNTELENKINESLLDILSGKTKANEVPVKSCAEPLITVKKNKDYAKFISILPYTPDGKVINLMLIGKNCRSKQQLTESELRMVTKILNNESSRIEENYGNNYRNVYYDAELDTNIRYEVKYELASEKTSVDSNFSTSNRIKKAKSKASDEASKEEGFVLNSVARTRCGRISRPPRHVIRDYKRLKRLNKSNNEVDDENENNGGYADYRVNEDSNSVNEIKTPSENESTTLYGPLEPSKRQFSSLSRCPSCDKVYLGYQRMAIHFQKYPEHRNEELLRRLLIRSKKKALEENNGLQTVLVNDSSTIQESPTASTSANGGLKRKGPVHRKFRMRGPKSHLKELLASFRIEDIIKYAAPVVATVLNSWEYLLLRSKKVKSSDQTLVASLIKEINIVIEQLRSLSHILLKPCEEDSGNSQNTFVVQEEDIMQHVLGVAPGKYTSTENEDWTRDCGPKVKKVDIKDEYAALCSSTVNSDDDVPSSLDCHLDESHKNSEINSFHHVITQQVPTTFSVTDLVHDIGKDLVVDSTTLSTQHAVINHNDHLEFSGESNRLFGNLKDSATSSMNISNGQVAMKDNNDSGLAVAQLEYLPSSFSPSHALSFDSLVGGVDDDLMNAFPISLPLLSDNSTDSKDYKDILNSLKGIDNAEKSELPTLENTLVNITASEPVQIDLLSALKNINDDGKSSMDVLGNSNSNNLIESVNGFEGTENTAGVLSGSLEETNRIDLLSGLKGRDSSDQSCMIDVQNIISNDLTEASNAPCILDFESLESNFPLNC